MSCSRARDTIQVRLDEPLPTDLEDSLGSHVSACKPCADYLKDLDAMRAAMRAMPPFALPADTVENLRSATQGGDTP